MDRVLKYQGLNLHQMSSIALREQWKINWKRMYLRGIVGGALGGMALFVQPVIALIPLGISAVTCFWLWQNNGAIRAELAARSNGRKAYDG